MTKNCQRRPREMWCDKHMRHWSLCLEEELSAANLQVGELQDIVRLCVSQGGLSFHVEGGKCPEDDTCDCPDALRVNAAMKGYTEKRVEPSPNQWAICGWCAGTGQDGPGTACPKCSGAGGKSLLT